MEIQFENIVLRDMKESDIEDYVRWFTTKTEWMNWDAPWEHEQTGADTERQRWTEYYESRKSMSDDAVRWRFEIEYAGKHIGWVTSYLIDENYDWISIKQVHEGKTVHQTVGIDICESEVWGKHIGTNALCALIRYYADRGRTEIYTQTWSGNERMIHTAEKIGFTVCDRDIDEREVQGKKYDALTFVLDLKQK